MPRCFRHVWLCLLLVCCNKQGSPDASNNYISPTTNSSVRSHPSKQEQADRRSKVPGEIPTDVAALTPEEREKELAAIAWDAIETDPKIAHEAFGKMTPGSPEKIRLIQHYALRLAAQQTDEAIEWAKSLEDETEQSAALSHIAIALAETDPQSAVNLLTEADLPGHDFEVAVVQVIQRWAAQSPAEAAAWVSLFPQNPAREAGVKSIAEQWLPSDTPAAFDWLSGMKDAELRQETARAMQGVILQQPEETRAAWLQYANETTQKELELQRKNALKEMGDNVPPSYPETPISPPSGPT